MGGEEVGGGGVKGLAAPDIVAPSYPLPTPCLKVNFYGL